METNTQLSDDQDFEHAVTHAQMMWRLSYKQECERRHARMEWNEAQANEALAASIEQDRLDEQQYQVRLANEAERQRKGEVNAQFWHSIKSVVLVIACVAIIFYTLIRVAG